MRAFGFAMADSDPDVAEHIGTITLGDVLGLAERQAQVPGPKGRVSSTALDGRAVSETAEAIRRVLKEAEEPLKIGDIRELVETDERHFKAAWGSVKSELKKIGAGRATAWSSSLDA